MSEDEGEGDGVWPPPPAAPPLEEAGPTPKRPRVTDQGIGRASLALSALGSLCALPYTVISAAVNHVPGGASALPVLQTGGGCFFAGFFAGFVGWFSWEGRVGLCSAVILPLLWLAVNLINLTRGS